MTARPNPFTPQPRVAKLDNHAKGRDAKIELRRRTLEAIGAENAHVFDAFAGAGEMFREVWHDAKSYTGCDLEWFRDARLAYAADNRRVMRSIDLAPFTIFDFDGYGSPWQQVLIMAARRTLAPGERIGVVMTEGTGLKMKQGGLPHALAEIAAMQNRPSGLFRWQRDIIDRAVRGMAQRMDATIEAQWRAERKANAAMIYIALILRRV